MICKAIKFKWKPKLKMANFTRRDLAFNGSQTTNAAEYLILNDFLKDLHTKQRS
jgi:hypothetical protein